AGEGRGRDRGHAVRHLGDGRELDRDLRVRHGGQGAEGLVALRDDGAAALDWVASYLERVRELPALAQVAPGDVRAALPASAPEHGEEVPAVLQDLDEILLPGITNWQSPRFFAYFSTTGSEPAILADLLPAGLNQVGILWRASPALQAPQEVTRASPALQELEEVTLAWLAELLGLPDGWHGHLEQGASVATLGALAAAREAK